MGEGGREGGKKGEGGRGKREGKRRKKFIIVKVVKEKG